MDLKLVKEDLNLIIVHGCNYFVIKKIIKKLNYYRPPPVGRIKFTMNPWKMFVIINYIN